jgi:hypothetical protein
VILRELIKWTGFLALAMSAGLSRADPAPSTQPQGNTQKGEDSEETQVEAPEPLPPPDLTKLAGRPIAAVEVVITGGRWNQPVALRSVRVGERFADVAAGG